LCSRWNGGLNRVMILEIDKTLDAVPFCETGDKPVSVLVGASH